MESAPYMVLGLILFAFVFFIVGSFIQDTNKKIEKDKKSTRYKPPRGSWYTGDR